MFEMIDGIIFCTIQNLFSIQKKTKKNQISEKLFYTLFLLFVTFFSKFSQITNYCYRWRKSEYFCVRNSTKMQKSFLVSRFLDKTKNVLFLPFFFGVWFSSFVFVTKCSVHLSCCVSCLVLMFAQPKQTIFFVSFHCYALHVQHFCVLIELRKDCGWCSLHLECALYKWRNYCKNNNNSGLFLLKIVNKINSL